MSLLTLLFLSHPVPPKAIAEANRLVGRPFLAPASRPALYYFIEKGCPCCRDAKPLIDRLHTRYGDVANVIGVVNEDAAGWARATKPRFRTIDDPGGRIARKAGAKTGTHLTLIGRNGRVLLNSPGYSAPVLRRIAALTERDVRIAPRGYDARPAPAKVVSGCAIPARNGR